MTDGMCEFVKGQRVRVTLPEARRGNANMLGKIKSLRYKPNPRKKLPGWWAVVSVDPPPGIKTMEMELHISGIEAVKECTF